MIDKSENQVILEFGTGDIGVSGGNLLPKDNTSEIVGIVGFSNQSPRAIGTEGDIKAGIVDNDKFDVMMLFTKKESIDVVIGQLEEAKKRMG